MLHDKDFEYFEKLAHWSFDEYDCRTECLTDWDLYEILKSVVTPDSHVLDLGTGGGEKLFKQHNDVWYLKPNHVFKVDASKEEIKGFVKTNLK